MDYLPVGKPNSYKDYELIYYINDVTIANEEVLVEYGANGTATGTYEYGLERLSVEYVNEAKEYYLYNGTGNVTQTTAQNGSMFLRYTYDPFGNVESINAPMVVDIDDLNRYTYNGEDYDFNTGLQYLRARYYSTSTGSFISQDTYLGQIINPISRNRFTYAHNSPVVFDDPSGHRASWYDFRESASKKWEKFKDKTTQILTGFKSEASNIYNKGKTYVNEKTDQAEKFKINVLCNIKEGIKNATSEVYAKILIPLVVIDNSMIMGTTRSVGVNISGAFGREISYNVLVARDGEGNIGLLYSEAKGLGTPSSSISLNGTITNAHTIDNLIGSSEQAGASITCEGCSLGVEGLRFKDSKEDEQDRDYYGGSFSIGIGEPSVEYHQETSETNYVPITKDNYIKFNMYQTLTDIYEKIMEW